VNSSGALVSLWYRGGYKAMRPEVTGHLGKVERMLVDAAMCPAADAEIHELRKGPWPRHHPGPATSISKFVYINMKWDHDRREYMDEQLGNLSRAWKADGRHFTWDRLEGVGASALQHDARYATWRNKGFSKSVKPNVQGDWGTASCAYNHYEAIRQIPNSSDDGLVVISEDDAEINPNFLQLWERLWPFVPQEWDVLRIGWFGDHQNCSQVVNPMVDRAGWQDPLEGECAYCGAQAYIVNPSSKRRVMERFERSKITHADELLGAPPPELEDPEKVPPLKAYVVWPVLASTRLDDVGYPFFHSDRIDGRKAVSDKHRAVADQEADQLTSPHRGGPKAVDIPGRYAHAVDAEIKAAAADAKLHAEKQAAAMVAAAQHAAKAAEAEARRAEKKAKEAETALELEKQREQEYYMTPKVAPTIAPPPPPPPPPLAPVPTYAPAVVAPAPMSWATTSTVPTMAPPQALQNFLVKK